MSDNPVADLLQKARASRSAIGAFNANTLEQVQAIARAAQIESAPVIIQVSHNALNYLGMGNSLAGLRYFHAMARTAIDSTPVPVYLHLDHGTYEEALEAIGLGYHSVMFDGGDRPLDENARLSARLCKIAHDAGVCMEAELGEVPKPGGTAQKAAGKLTDPDQAADFAERTGIDSLAVSIGSTHGREEKRACLKLDLLERIASRVSIPLVLHGSSGVTDEEIRAGIRLGLCKINTATQSNVAFTKGLKAFIAQNESVVDPRKYLDPARENMVQAVRERIRTLAAAGTAAGAAAE